MKEDLHERARRLIIASWVEGNSPADQEWLNSHLESCAGCTELASATERVLRTFRSATIHIEPALVSATRIRVRLRSQEVRQQQVQVPFLLILSALSWVWMLATTRYLWRGFEWIGHLIEVPALVWQMGFILWWALPAVAVAAMLTVQKLQSANQGDSSASMPR